MTENDDENDLQEALIWLAGYLPAGDRGSARLYLRKDLSEEKAARAALVRILEGDKPVPYAIRYQLAALFDPNPELSWETEGSSLS